MTKKQPGRLYLVGVGPGSGFGLLIFLCGIGGMLVGLSGYLVRDIRNLDRQIPDYPHPDTVVKVRGTQPVLITGTCHEETDALVPGDGPKHTNSSVNNPAEAVSHWKAGRLKPLAVIDHERIALPDWDKILTMKEATGVDMSYMMLRGIFAAPGITKEQQDFYVDCLKKVTETPEWKKYVSDMGLKAAFLSGPDYAKWVGEQEAIHKELMTKGGLIKWE